MNHVVIIGGVAAGMSAASKIRRLNPNVKISVFEKGDIVSYGACGLPYYISGVIPSHEKLIIRTPEQFKENGINIYLKNEVVKVFPADRKILVKDIDKKDFKVVSYDKLLIATGASPIKLPFMKEDLKNVFPLRDILDGQMIKDYASKTYIKHATIIGAGYIGLELVESMLEMGKKVRIIEGQSQILPMYDKDIAEIVEKALLKKGVEIIKNEIVKEVECRNGEAKKVITNNGQYFTDMILVNIGVRPNTQFLSNTNVALCKKGAIIVDEYMRTSERNIFAAGDCATSYHIILEQLTYSPLGTVANKQGRVAAENIAGNNKKFPGVLGTSVVKVNELTIAKTGITEKEAIDHKMQYKSVIVTVNSHASYYPDPKPIYIKLVYDPKSLRLLGAQMVGEEGVAKRIDIFATAIFNKMSTDEIGMLDLSYAPPYATVWDAVQIASNVAK